jgi:hypothetical protein
MHAPDSAPGTRASGLPVGSLETCIPTQRPSPLFSEALGSVIEATVPGLSLLVFQNSTEPHLREEDLSAFPGPRRLVCSGAALGIGDSWNRVLELGQGDWIHLLHDDDWIEPDFYRAFLRDLESSPPFGLWLCGTIESDAEGRALNTLEVPDLVSNDAGRIAALLLQENVFRCVSVVMNRRDAIACGGFDRRMRQILDVDLFFRLACARGVRFHAGPLGHYRLHAKSTTGTIRKDEQGRPVSIPIFDDHRLLRDHRLFLAKQSKMLLAPGIVRPYSAGIIWSTFRYYIKRLRFRSLLIWLGCWAAHLHYCVRSSGAPPGSARR